MDVVYKDKKIQRICTDKKTAERSYGKEMAIKIHLRMREIKAADSVDEMLRSHVGRCHPLSQNRKGQFAMDLSHPYRLIFTMIDNQIQIVRILEIVDYH